MKYGLVRHLFEEDGGDGNNFMAGQGNNSGTSGEGEGASGQAGDDQGASSGNEATPDVDYKYPTGLDESYHGNPTLLKYANKETGEFNHAELAKALIHATSHMGADKIPVPHKNFTDDDWKDFNKKIGIPEKLDDYKVDPNVPEGMENNEEVFNNYKKLAHEQGLRPSQAQAILDFYNSASKTGAEAQQEAYSQQVDQNRAALEKEWGNGFEKNMNACDQALRHFFPDEVDQKAIAETGFLDTVIGTKFFHKLSEGLKEEHFTPEGQGTFGATNDELQDKIATLSQELLDIGKTHPQYQSKLRQYQDALNKRHGNNPVGATR